MEEIIRLAKNIFSVNLGHYYFSYPKSDDIRQVPLNFLNAVDS